jgi:hypothetical protein
VKSICRKIRQELGMQQSSEILVTRLFELLLFGFVFGYRTALYTRNDRFGPGGQRGRGEEGRAGFLWCGRETDNNQSA